MPVPVFELQKFDQVIEARESFRQDASAKKLSVGAIREYYGIILQGIDRSIQESSFWSKEERFAVFVEQLGSMHLLMEDWDSYGAPAPSRQSIGSAKLAVERLRFSQLLPSIVTPSAEGGVSIYFSRGSQKAFIEFLNEGDVLLARYGKDDEPNVKVLRNGLQDLNDQAIQEIRDHLGAGA
jgi:hypothetical protein